MPGQVCGVCHHVEPGCVCALSSRCKRCGRELDRDELPELRSIAVCAPCAWSNLTRALSTIPEEALS